MAAIKEQKAQVAAFRTSFRSRPTLTVGEVQKHFPSRAPVKGPVWIAQEEVRVSGENGVRDRLFETIHFSSTGPLVLPALTETHVRDVHTEWLGQRKGAARDARPPPDLSEAQLYERLQAEVENDLTIIFAHGGAFYSGTAATSRATTSRLARLTKARVLSVDYRLAPQSQFPAQLLDLFLVFLAQMYPPPGSYHPAVPSSKIVLAGESSGGGLCLSLVQLILQLQRSQSSDLPTVCFGGRDVHVPMPAGVAVLSAECERSFGLPSWRGNGHVDFLQELQPANDPAVQPSDEIWPSKPPRHDVYCHSTAYLHPISNPGFATTWKGSPPLWLAYGEERCIDGGKLIASLAAKQGVVVRFSEYRDMPHIFSIVLPHFKQSQACMTEWAIACLELGSGKIRDSQAKVISSAREPGDVSTKVDAKELCAFSADQATAMIRAAARARPLYTGKIAIRSEL